MNGETRQRVAKAIVAEEILSLAKELIAIPSHPGVPFREKEVAAAMDRFFRREGIASRLEEVEEGRPNVYAELGAGKGPTLLWCGHTDTVRADLFEGDPFAPRQEGDLLVGRGAVDMKASLACAMVALAGLKRARIDLAGKVLFAGVTDEEDRSAGCRALLRKQWRIDGAIVGEPTGLQPCLGHRGLEWLEIAFQGRAVHGGRAEEGINAISLAGKFLHRVETDLLPRLIDRRHPLLGCSTLNWGWIQGGTQPSTVAGNCRLQLDRRWIPQERYQDVLAELQSVLDSLHGED
ncbi:MAG: M20/M25/M40 family metallo-hydrolase, partial [Coprothermobacterota bacterium]|nr:M20/M25/M40 family metallo-hydrolase [Coprothermobacterota bacterium]